MLYEWPKGLKVQTLDNPVVKNVVSTEARNNRITSAEVSLGRYDLRVRCVIEPQDIAGVEAWLEAMQRNNAYTFYTDNQWGTQTTTTAVLGAPQKGDTQFQLGDLAIASDDGFTANFATGEYWLNVAGAGSLITFSNHSKLYRIMSIDANAVTLTSPLRANIGGATAEIGKPAIKVELAPDLKRNAEVTKTTHRDLGRANLRFVEIL